MINNRYEKKTGIETTLEYIQRDVQEIKQKLETDYVSRDEFIPIKNLVYGLAGSILLGVLGAIGKLLLTH